MRLINCVQPSSPSPLPAYVPLPPGTRYRITATARHVSSQSILESMRSLLFVTELPTVLLAVHDGFLVEVFRYHGDGAVTFRSWSTTRLGTAAISLFELRADERFVIDNNFVRTATLADLARFSFLWEVEI